MAGKQITELESTNKISEGDLLFVRKTTSGTDKKINYTDLVESIGNPAIEGFIATVDPLDANTIILTPANNARIPRYFVGMKISFVSPITSNGNVKIKVGSLTAKDFVQYQTTVTVGLQVDDYVEGVFIGDKFHRINDLRSVANIYSNEYNVILTTIDPSEQFTTLNLVSSIGIPKQSYYDGMAISFINIEDTKGTTIIKIDDITTGKGLIEPNTEDDFISLPLYANQIIRAVYRISDNSFIRDIFQVQDPKQKPLINTKEPTTNEEIEQAVMPEENTPPQNLKEYSIDNVSKGSYSYVNLNDCINKIIESFPTGVDSGVKVTITINKTLDASNTLLTVDRDLSWVTLRSDNQSININKNGTKGYIFTQTSGRFFNFEKDTIITIINVVLTESATFLNISNGNIILNGLTIIGDNLTYCFSMSPAVKMELTNCHLKNMRQHIYSVGASITLTGCTLKNWLLHALLVVPSANVIVKLTNCDLRKSQNSSLDDIVTITNNYYTKLTITQINTKARFGQNGLEIQPNSTTSLLEYNVSGGQN